MTSPEPRTNTLVSVIIPVYNGERFIAGAIRNVLEQDYAPLDIVVVDDGSTDATARIAAQFGHTIRYIYQARRGPAAARNRGIRTAQGGVIAFLDVDDAWPRGKLRRQVAHLVRHPEAGIAQGLIVRMELDRSTRGTEPVFEECSEPYQFVNLGSAVYRADLFDTVGLFDENLHENEDTDWFFRAWENNVTKVVQDSVALYYRRHTHNMTLEQHHPQSSMVGVFKRHLDRYREHGLSAAATVPGRPGIAAYIGAPPTTRRTARVRDKTFTIISNDCWGSGPYHHGGLMYLTPFIGTRILAPCYLELLKNLEMYLAAPLEFVDTSRYTFMNNRREALLEFYPIALLRGTVEVHFLHEPDQATCRHKWERRCAKMNLNNLFVKFSQDPEVCTDALLEEFDRLDYPYKVCFTQRDYPALASTVTMPDYFVPGAPMYFLSRRYFDTVAWLDRRHGPDTRLYRLPAANPAAYA